MSNEHKQPFLSHLEELRKRFIYSFIAVGITFAVSFIFAKELYGLLTSPLIKILPEGEESLYFTGLTEPFFTYLKTALISGVLIASPVIFYQIWKFIAPGLYQNERKYIVPFVVFSTVLFVGGALFGYFVVFPYGFTFFMGFENENLKALLSVKEYFSLSSRLLLAFGLVFELPVVMFFMAKMGVINVPFLKKYRKYAILLSFVASAILTPPDPTTQCMMAVPIIVLYEVGIILARFAKPNKKEEEEKE